MQMKRKIHEALEKIPLEELSYYVAHTRSERTLVKRLSSIIQNDIFNDFIVRNEYTDKSLMIKDADLVIFSKNNRHNVKMYAEVKWLLSHHLFEEKKWEYRQNPKHNHHSTLKVDLKKLLSAEIPNAKRLFLLFLSHYHSLDVPPYWTDQTLHRNSFSKKSLEIEIIEDILKQRLIQTLTSTEGLTDYPIKIPQDLQIPVNSITLKTTEQIDISLMYVVLDLNEIWFE